MGNLTFEEFKTYPDPRTGKPVLKGLAVGYCIKGQEWDDNANNPNELGAGKKEHAHAHFGNDDRYDGWICVRRNDELGRYDRVSGTLMHELAHLLSRHGHDDSWRRWMKRLGQFVAPAWQKRARARV
jgi:hypothetical protein